MLPDSMWLDRGGPARHHLGAPGPLCFPGGWRGLATIAVHSLSAEWRYAPDGSTLNRYSPVRARLCMVALRELLQRYPPWEYAFDQTFQKRYHVRSAVRALDRYARLLASLPCGFAPARAWAVAEPHPGSRSGLWHLHGLWSGLPDAWSWRDCKEYLWGVWGSARFHRVAVGGSQGALVGRVEYAAGHAVKSSPTRFWDSMTVYTRREVRPGYRRVRYVRGCKWHQATWVDGEESGNGTGHEGEVRGCGHDA